MQVLKFGGSSVATPERIKSVIDIISNRADKKNMVVVFSALGGITDQLIEITSMALEGNLAYKDGIAIIENRHLDAVRELIPMAKQSGPLAETKSKINELEEILHGIFLVGEKSARTLDFILSFGEQLSTYIIAEAIASTGIAAEYLDARRVIRTDSSFGHAQVDFETTNALAQEYFSQHKTAMQVVTGFIASSHKDETTTLGRSGSDYTAAILAGALKADVLEIWTDVNGLMTADPRVVKQAFTVPMISYEEAMELSHFGAKVIFPSTMQPAMSNQIPILIKNSFNPSHEGTLITKQSNPERMIKGISSLGNMALLTVQGVGLLGIVGVAKRLFTALSDADINVVLISQASSEHSICVGIHRASKSLAKDAIEREFAPEMKHKLIDQVQVDDGVSIIAIVGDGMKYTPGSSGRMFGILGKNGINVIAIAQGSSERNISAVVQDKDVSKALNSLHDSFFLSNVKTLNLFLVGVGLIGKTLLKQMNEQNKNLAEKFHLRIKLVGVANSTKMFFDERGIGLPKAIVQMHEQGQAMRLESFMEQAIQMNLPNSVFVDCSSSQEVADTYAEFLKSNISIVTPNKKANSKPWKDYTDLKNLSQSHNVRFLYETNVGAGLPVINTLNDLILSGDKIIRIEGVLSGTLNYIFSAFKSGVNFSDIVAEAKAKGYTEPDPRDDLSGMDVARKILILAREAGAVLELEDVSVQNLVPEDCQKAESVEAFFKQLKKHDADFAKRIEAAEKKNRKLRYNAVYENGVATVRLNEVDAEHPFYSLDGSDNIILLTTDRYHDRPMVIKGPGAGAEVTATGVYADIIRIGNYA